MPTFLFDEIVFGPVKSRRFGVSLGMNLLPVGYKYCTFNCIYCECGWTHEENSKSIKLPGRKDIFHSLDERLKELEKQHIIPDNITFAGNGEPTVHPEFAGVISDTISLRNKYFPKTEITVLSNSTMLHKKEVFEALNKIDNNVLKLDSAIEETYKRLNQPYSKKSLESIIENIKKFKGNQIIQTLFIKGEFNGSYIDNTTNAEVDAWLRVIQEIQPKYVMIYPIDRDTPVKGLQKISKPVLDKIARLVHNIHIKTEVYY